MNHHHNRENVETLQLVNDANKVFAATDFPSVHQFWTRATCTYSAE